MGILWKVALVTAVGTALFEAGLSVAEAVALSFAGFLLMFRRRICEMLFPLQAYRENCLSIQGLSSQSELEQSFRRELGKVLWQLFPVERPTGCCCVSGSEEGYTAVLVLHRKEGHLQVRVSGDSPNAAAGALLMRLREELPPFQATSSLSRRCQKCSIGKAHGLINSHDSRINPLSYRPKWGRFWARFSSVGY